MTNITVQTKLSTQDFIWNQVYQWYHGWWQRVLAFCFLAGVFYFTLNALPNSMSENQRLFIALFSAGLGYVGSYIADAIVVACRTYWVVQKNPGIYLTPTTSTFTDTNIDTQSGNDRSTLSYQHYDRVFFYKRHILVHVAGMSNVYKMIKFSDIPQDQREPLKNLLTTKITKVKK